jgi:hypothetical protein
MSYYIVRLPSRASDNNNVKWDKIKYLQSSNSIVLKGYLPYIFDIEF